MKIYCFYLFKLLFHFLFVESFHPDRHESFTLIKAISTIYQFYEFGHKRTVFCQLIKVCIFVQAILGGKVEVPTLLGKTQVNVITFYLQLNLYISFKLFQNQLLQCFTVHCPMSRGMFCCSTWSLFSLGLPESCFIGDTVYERMCSLRCISLH